MKLTGTGSRPSRSSCEHALACLLCQGRIPRGTHRGSIVYLWNIPVDRSFERRLALQLSTKVVKQTVQRSSVSQHHVGYRIILHWKRLGIKSKVATTYDLNADLDPVWWVMLDGEHRWGISYLAYWIYKLLKTDIKKFLECWLFILMWFVNRGDELKDGVSNSYSSWCNWWDMN